MANKQHSLAAQTLTWVERPFDNGVGGREYIAVSDDLTFSIVEQNPNGPASMRWRRGDAESSFVGTFTSVKQAQFRARRLVDEQAGLA